MQAARTILAFSVAILSCVVLWYSNPYRCASFFFAWQGLFPMEVRMPYTRSALHCSVLVNTLWPLTFLGMVGISWCSVRMLQMHFDAAFPLQMLVNVQLNSSKHRCCFWAAWQWAS